MFESGFTCPFCQKLMAVHHGTYVNRDISYSDRFDDKSRIQCHFFRCPACKKTSIAIEGIGEEVEGMMKVFYPDHFAKVFPEYIPQAIRDDYTEACTVEPHSPKASATLSRRCLEGMISDFWGIRKKNLYLSIDALKDKISAVQWDAIDAVRKVGNIGAHMQADVNVIVDVEPSEAQSLIKLIELLLDKWYIARHDEEQLFETVRQIGETKDEQRKLVEDHSQDQS